MSFFKRYQDLVSRVETAVDAALGAEVAETVKDIMQEQLEYQVYSYEASAQAMATRRLDSGGLLDRGYMLSRVEAGHTLVVEDAAPFQGGPADRTALAGVVERGAPSFQQPYPRPFIAGTERESVSSGRALQALREGLKRQGL